MQASNGGSVARPKRRQGECINLTYHEGHGKLYVEIDLTRPEYVTRMQRRLMLASTHGRLLVANGEAEVTINAMSHRCQFDRVNFDAARSAWHEIMADLLGREEVG